MYPPLHLQVEKKGNFGFLSKIIEGIIAAKVLAVEGRLRNEFIEVVT